MPDQLPAVFVFGSNSGPKIRTQSLAAPPEELLTVEDANGLLENDNRLLAEAQAVRALVEQDATPYTDAQAVAANAGVISAASTADRQRANHTGTQAASTINDFAAAADARITAQKAAPNGLATLDANGKQPLTQVPDALLGQVKYKGTYSFASSLIASPDAALNGDVLPASSTATAGYYFIVQDAGTVSGKAFMVGDWLISNGAAGWDKVDNTDAVATVAGRTGNVVLSATDIAGLPVAGTTAGTYAAGNDARLSDARTPLTHSHTASQISDFNAAVAAAVGGPVRVLALNTDAAVTGTGVQVETTLFTGTIPAGTLGPNGSLDIYALFSMTSSGTTKRFKVKVGGITIGDVSATTSASGRYLFTLTNRNSLTSQIGGPAAQSSFGSTGSANVTTSADFGQPVEVLITATLTAATDTVTLNSCRVLAYK